MTLLFEPITDTELQWKDWSAYGLTKWKTSGMRRDGTAKMGEEGRNRAYLIFDGAKETGLFSRSLTTAIENGNNLHGQG